MDDKKYFEIQLINSNLALEAINGRERIIKETESKNKEMEREIVKLKKMLEEK